MTKQEEIREGINWLIRYAKPEDGTTMGDILFKYLHSQGVVITTHGFYSDLMEPLIKEK